MAAYGALQPVAGDAANGRRCPSLCENAQEPTRRRIVFSIALFPNAAAAAPRAAPVPRWSAGLALAPVLGRRCQAVRSPMPGSECAGAWRRLLPEVVIQAGGSPTVAIDYSAPPPGVTRFSPGRPQPARKRIANPESRSRRTAARPLKAASGEGPLTTEDRGRDAHCWTPPAQIRTSPIRASGSYLGCLTAKR